MLIFLPKISLLCWDIFSKESLFAARLITVFLIISLNCLIHSSISSDLTILVVLQFLHRYWPLYNVNPISLTMILLSCLEPLKIISGFWQLGHFLEISCSLLSFVRIILSWLKSMFFV